MNSNTVKAAGSTDGLPRKTVALVLGKGEDGKYQGAAGDTRHGCGKGLNTLRFCTYPLGCGGAHRTDVGQNNRLWSGAR